MADVPVGGVTLAARGAPPVLKEVAAPPPSDMLTAWHKYLAMREHLLLTELNEVWRQLGKNPMRRNGLRCRSCGELVK